MSGRRWARLGMALVGLGISVYLTVVHYGHVPLACPLARRGIVDCAAVVTSPQSVALGLPLAVWGIAWFVVTAALVLRAGPGQALAERAWATVGAVAVVYFVYLELFAVGRLCAWCTAVHLLVLANLILVGMDAG